MLGRASTLRRLPLPLAAMPLPPAELEAIRRSRRYPRATQVDYLHLRFMIDGLRDVLRSLPEPERVLDVWCGTRPYDDLFPRGTPIVGFDVEGNPYGVADVVSDTFLPFADESFDLVMCIQAFQFVPDPVAAIAEFRRVLRRGGVVLIALPFAFEYDPTILERRYTGPQLAALFGGWDDVRLHEHGGRAVTWTVLTASLVRNVDTFARRRRLLRGIAPLFTGAYVMLNGLGLVLAKLEERRTGSGALPMNLLLTARRPPSAAGAQGRAAR
jgi:SAM-dependent methyltransferase